MVHSHICISHPKKTSLRPGTTEEQLGATGGAPGLTQEPRFHFLRESEHSCIRGTSKRVSLPLRHSHKCDCGFHPVPRDVLGVQHSFGIALGMALPCWLSHPWRERWQQQELVALGTSPAVPHPSQLGFGTWGCPIGSSLGLHMLDWGSNLFLLEGSFGPGLFQVLRSWQRLTEGQGTPPSCLWLCGEF